MTVKKLILLGVGFFFEHLGREKDSPYEASFSSC